MKVFKYDSINIDNISLSKLDRNKNLIYVKYNTDNRYLPLLIETDYMLMNFDASYENTDSVSYEILLSLIGKSDASTYNLRNFFSNLDSKVMNMIKTNMNSWFKINENEKVRYKMLIRDIDENENVLKIKLRKSKSFKSIVFNEKLQEITKNKMDDYLIKGNYVKVIFELPYIKFENKTFSLYLKVHQIKVSNISEEYSSDIHSDIHSELSSSDFDTNSD